MEKQNQIRVSEGRVGFKLKTPAQKKAFAKMFKEYPQEITEVLIIQK